MAKAPSWQSMLRWREGMVYGLNRGKMRMLPDLSVADFTRGMQKLISGHSQLDTRIKIVVDDDSVIFIDGKSTPHAVSNNDGDADVTLWMSLRTLNKLYRRELNPAVAAMTGKIRMEGNLLEAMKLESVLRPFA